MKDLKIKKSDINLAKNYKDVFVLMVGFVILQVILKNSPYAYLLHWIALFIGISSIVSFKLMNYILWIWQKLGIILGWINSRIILSLFFFLILTPIALISRVVKRDVLNIKQRDCKSMFIERNHTFSSQEMEEIS